MPQSDRARFAVPAGAALTALCAWISQGTLAFTGRGSDRVAVLPVSIGAFSIVAVAAAAFVVAARRGASLAPLWLLAFVLLPWLPFGVPDALVLWSGPIVLLIWIAVAASMTADVWPRRPRTPSRPELTAGLLALVIYAVAAWQVSPSVPDGDEPQYLVIAQSLLLDGDLRIENNHRRGDYESYFARELRPDYLRRGSDGKIYSIHAPGLPALIAPAFAVAGYRGVVVLLICISALGSALAWRLASRLTGRTDAAWFAWAAVSLSATAIFHSFTVFPDGVGGVLVLSGAWAILRARDERRTPETVALRPWVLHGAALALLPWLHTRFALLAGALGGVVLVRLAATRRPVARALAFLSVPIVSSACWFGYFIAVYGTPSPMVPYGGDLGSTGYIADGIAGLFMDQRFGLLPYAPVLVAALAGFVVMLAPGAFRMPEQPEQRRIAVELLLVCVPYLLAVTTFRMWWAGWSPPARFLEPILPLFVLPAASTWVAVRRRATRATLCAALVFTLFASGLLVLASGGSLAFNVRTEYAHWLEWLARNVDLGAGMPAWRAPVSAFFRDIAVWCAAMLAAWGILRAVDCSPWLRSRAALATATAAVYAAAAMSAATITWALSGSRHTGQASGQVDLLREIASERPAIGIGVSPPRWLPSGAIATSLRLRLSGPPALESPASDVPMFVLSRVPAGRYRLVPRARRSTGVLSVGIGRERVGAPVAETAAALEPILVGLPVDVGSLVVRGDDAAWGAVRGLTVESLALVPASARLTDDSARRAARYDHATVYFLDDRSFVEPSAFWIAGASRSSIVVRYDVERSVASFVLRNAPVVNRVTIASDRWRDQVDLGPGEERRIDVPLRPHEQASRITITSSSGFRPSAVDPASEDRRFLGVWMELVQ